MADLVSRAVIVATIGTGLIGIAAATVLTYLLTQPIKELVEVLDAAGRGNLSQRARIRTRDEIGRLSEAFNGMIECSTVPAGASKLARRGVPAEPGAFYAQYHLCHRQPIAVLTGRAGRGAANGAQRDEPRPRSGVHSRRNRAPSEHYGATQPAFGSDQDTEAWELGERAAETIRTGQFGMRSIARRVLLFDWLDAK